MNNREQVMSELMKENEEVAAQRRQLKEMHDLLLKASEILNEVCIFFFFFLV